MHRSAFLLGLVLTAVIAAASPSSAVDIRELHKNTSSGVPNRTGLRFAVTGKVTVPDGVRSSTNTEVAIQDSTGGITLFELGGSGFSFELGDSLTIEGDVSQFNGLTELVNLGNYTLHTQGLPDANPLVLTCLEVENTWFNSFPDSFPEVNESRLIRINGVSLVSGTWPSTCAGANSVLTIEDETGTTTLFIDRDSEVCGSPAPTGSFDVIGYLTQFDSSAPYNTGYEIVPRFVTDIIPTTPGPRILSGPEAINIDSTSAEIVWTTDTQSTSLVGFGTGPAFGMTEGDSTLVTDHSVVLTGLQPGTLYYYFVSNTDTEGTTASAPGTFVTPSNTPGDINVYFSKDIDPSVAVLDTAAGNVALQDIIINRCESAQHDISVAIYSFNLASITNALLDAWNRGVKVRLILDTGVSQTQANVLRNAGVPVITHNFPGAHPSIHHNKFFVFDARDETSQTDDWIWTGSFNMTNESTAMSNNGVEIQDSGLAQAYLLEFNEMWGSDDDSPVAANSRFSTDKLDNTPHNFVISGIPMELYFSPSDGTEQQIVNEINDAQSSTYFQLLVFTSNPIANALESKHNGIGGFQVRGVFDAGNANQTGSEYPNMIGGGSNPWSPPADVHVDGDPYTIHDKFGIVDATDWNSDPTVITGSHNWSNAANTTNDENTLIIHDANIANQYLQSFSQRYQSAGGTGDFVVVSVGDRTLPGGIRFSSPYPNPSRTGGVIEWSLPGSIAAGQRTTIQLYDMRGRLVRTVVDREAQPGTHRISFNGRDRNGQRLTPGVYFLRLNAVGASLSQKWVVLD